MEGNNELQKENYIPLIIIVLVGAVVSILNQTLLTTALPSIMVDLHVSANIAQWLTTVFMLVNGVMIPFAAFLIGTFTTRQLFFASMSFFGVGTLVCGIAPTFSILLAGRIIQAVGSGIMIPLIQTIFMLIFPPEKRGFAMGLVGLVYSFAPAVGPVLSGWIVDHYPWRMLFIITLPVTILTIAVSIFVMKNVTKQTFPKIDILSILMSTVGFGGVLFGFSIAGIYGWSHLHVILSLVVGFIVLIFYIIRQLKLPVPILEFRIFKYPVFSLSTIIVVINFSAMIGMTTILPLYMQHMHHFTALESGLVLLPGAIVMGLMSPVTGYIFDRIGGRFLAIFGLTIVTITTFLFTNLSIETSITYLTVVYAVRMVGISMVTMPISTAAMNVLPATLLPHGSAILSTMRQAAGAIGAALLVTIMTISAQPIGNALDPTGMIQGVNTAFLALAFVTMIGIVLSFFIHRNPSMKQTQAEERQQHANV